MQKLFSMILVCIGMAIPFGLYAHKKERWPESSQQNGEWVTRLVRWEEKDKKEMTRAQLRRKGKQEAKDKREGDKIVRQMLLAQELASIDAANVLNLKKKKYWKEKEAASRR